MEARHIKFNAHSALDSKKQILSLEINFLHLLRLLKSYSLLRKKEFSEKNKLRVCLNSLKTEATSLISTFPRQEIKTKKKTEIRGIKKQTRKKLHEEVEEIKRKLEKLAK